MPTTSAGRLRSNGGESPEANMKWVTFRSNFDSAPSLRLYRWTVPGLCISSLVTFVSLFTRFPTLSNRKHTPLPLIDVRETVKFLDSPKEAPCYRGCPTPMANLSRSPHPEVSVWLRKRRVTVHRLMLCSTGQNYQSRCSFE